MSFRFSVIMPVYNVRDYVEASIKSILYQTYDKEFELIIVDDGSTDGSSEIIDSVVSGYEGNVKITVLKKENGGCPSARNAALDIAKGDYIVFIDSDDVYLDAALLLFSNKIDEHPDVDLIISGGYDICNGVIDLKPRYDVERFDDEYVGKKDCIECLFSTKKGMCDIMISAKVPIGILWMINIENEKVGRLIKSLERPNITG